MKIAKTILLLLLITILSMQLVNAVQISLRPATIEVPNMVQGGYYEVEYLLNVNTQEDTLVKMELDESPINDWITLEPSEREFYVSESNPRTIKMIIQPTQNVANGNYQGALRYSIIPDITPEGQTSVVIQPGLVSRLNITITSNRVTDCRVVKTNIENVELFDDLNLEVEVYNNGNIDAKPEINYVIYNSNKEEELSGVESNTIVKPTQRINVQNTIEQSLKPGQYFIDISVPNCQDYSEQKTFDILEWGEKTSQITFTNLYPEKVWNNVSDTIKVYALAKNTGTQKVKEAQFVGTIELDGELKEVVATKSRELKPDEEVAFQFEFTPKVSGKYFITGTIQYDGKETFEKTTPVNVNPKDNSKSKLISTENLLLVLVVAIVFALILITYIKKKD